MKLSFERRKGRRLLTIKVMPDNAVRVLMPMRFPMRFAEAFVEKKMAWIRKVIAKNRDQAHTRLNYVSEEPLLYLGREYTLLIKPSKTPEIKLEAGHLVCRTPLETRAAVQKMVVGWYRQRAMEIIPDRVEIYAKKFKLKPSAVSIKSMKSRWGSCSSKGKLNFTWGLMATPLPVLDYVVIHELAHIKHLNHSSAFWKTVEGFMPEYKQHEEWLRTEGRNLLRIW